MNLTHTQLTTILAESATMRSIVSQAFLTDTSDKRKLIEGIVLDNRHNKIQAIKDVREKLIASDVYPLYSLDWNRGGTDTRLGLADSKMLVEHVGHTLGIYF